MGFWYSVCPLTKYLPKNSPTDLNMQTAIDSKDQGIFLAKPMLCQELYISQIHPV